jgi:hypothetical protein
VSDDLMTVEVEIDPLVRASALGTAEQLAVKAASRGKVIDRESEMERREAHEFDMSSPASRRNAAFSGLRPR